MTQYGFYLHTPHVIAWNWPAVTGMSIAGPGKVHLTGRSSVGPVSWLLHTGWAVLIFLIWALSQYPRHPQLVTGVWLPPGWAAHFSAHSPHPQPVPELAAESARSRGEPLYHP